MQKQPEIVQRLTLPPRSTTPIPVERSFGLVSGNVPDVVLEVDGRDHVISMGQVVPIGPRAIVKVINPFSVQAELSYCRGWDAVGSVLFPRRLEESVTFRAYYADDQADMAGATGLTIETKRPSLIRVEHGNFTVQIITPKATFEDVAPVTAELGRPRNGGGITDAVAVRGRSGALADLASNAADAFDINWDATTDRDGLLEQMLWPGTYCLICPTMDAGGFAASVEITELASPRR